MNKIILIFLSLISLPLFTFAKQTEIAKQTEMPKEKVDIREIVDHIDPHWIHQIVEKDDRDWQGIFYTFDDETVWSIYGVKNWDSGDQILIIYDPEGGVESWDFELEINFRYRVWEFYNITKNEYGRGDYWFIERKWVENVTKVSGFTDYYNTVILSNGLRLHKEQNMDQIPLFVNWKKDQIVILVISKEGSSSYQCLLNLTTWDVFCDLQIR